MRFRQTVRIVASTSTVRFSMGLIGNAIGQAFADLAHAGFHIRRHGSAVVPISIMRCRPPLPLHFRLPICAQFPAHAYRRHVADINGRAIPAAQDDAGNLLLVDPSGGANDIGFALVFNISRASADVVSRASITWLKLRP